MLNRYSGYDPRNVCTASSGLPTSNSRTPRLRNAVRKSKPASVASWKSSTMTSFGRSDVSASFTAAAASIMSCEASRRYWSGYASLMAWLYSARSAKASRHCTRSRSRRSSSVPCSSAAREISASSSSGFAPISFMRASMSAAGWRRRRWRRPPPCPTSRRPRSRCAIARRWSIRRRARHVRHAWRARGG